MNDEPIITIPVPITTAFIRNHIEYTFLYGYDVQGKGAFGQAVAAHGEPNCFPIYTCWKMCKTSAYFSDGQMADILKINGISLANACRHSLSHGSVVIPFPKIGRGYSRMSEFAPQTYRILMERIKDIQHPHINYIYG